MLLGRDRADDGDEQAYRTLAGLVLAQLDRLPSIGDALELEGLRIEVVDLDGPWIDKILVTPVT